MFNNLSYNICIRYIPGIILLLFATVFSGYTQVNTTVFEDFTQTNLNSYLINPSATDTSYRYNIRVNALDELGLIKYVNRFYADADVKLPSSRKHSYHFIGLQALNSKLGQYISRSRLQGRYSWYTQLSRGAAVSAGVSFGFVNYSFLTTQGGTGGSALGPDGMIGIHYIRYRTTVGFAIQQLFTPVLIPVDQAFRLKRLYNIDISHRFTLSPWVNITAFTTIQYSGAGNYTFNFGMMGDVADLLIIGLNNYSLRKTSFNAGVKNIRLFGGELTIISTYSVYHSTFPLPDSTLELFLALQK